MNNDNKFYIPISGKMEADPNYNEPVQEVELPVLRGNEPQPMEQKDYYQEQPQQNYYQQQTDNYNNYQAPVPNNNYNNYNNYNNNYNQPPQQEETNVLAIIGLVLAFLMPPVGGVVSIIALNQIKKTGQKGKGIAIAGIIVGFFAIVAIIAILAISVILSTLIWPSVESNIHRSTYCAQAFNCSSNYDGTQSCNYMDEYGEIQEVICNEDE